MPLTLLTLDAWDFVKLTRSECDICGEPVAVPHKWTFYFLISVGFWNFVGAGIFGFLINLPIVSYFQAGTLLTPNHGHAAMMGVFGMLAMALTVFALRQAAPAQLWERLEPYIRLSFWGLNVGLALMSVSNLLPAGVLQLVDVLENGYWHARSGAFLDRAARRGAGVDAAARRPDFHCPGYRADGRGRIVDLFREAPWKRFAISAGDDILKRRQWNDGQWVRILADCRHEGRCRIEGS